MTIIQSFPAVIALRKRCTARMANAPQRSAAPFLPQERQCAQTGQQNQGCGGQYRCATLSAGCGSCRGSADRRRVRLRNTAGAFGYCIRDSNRVRFDDRLGCRFAVRCRRFLLGHEQCPQGFGARIGARLREVLHFQSRLTGCILLDGCITARRPVCFHRFGQRGRVADRRTVCGDVAQLEHIAIGGSATQACR